VKSQYKIGKLIDQGSYGFIYKITDSKDTKRPLVMKIQQNAGDLAKEIHQMKKV
jgi:serine/threonine protein kinase